MATLEKKNIQIHKQPNITGLNEFIFKKSENKTPKQAERNTKCAGNRAVQSPVFSGSSTRPLTSVGNVGMKLARIVRGHT